MCLSVDWVRTYNSNLFHLDFAPWLLSRPVGLWLWCGWPWDEKKIHSRPWAYRPLFPFSFLTGCKTERKKERKKESGALERYRSLPCIVATATVLVPCDAAASGVHRMGALTQVKLTHVLSLCSHVWFVTLTRGRNVDRGRGESCRSIRWL